MLWALPPGLQRFLEPTLVLGSGFAASDLELKVRARWDEQNGLWTAQSGKKKATLEEEKPCHGHQDSKKEVCLNGVVLSA